MSKLLYVKRYAEELEKVRSDFVWLNANYDAIQKYYDGEFVAVKNQTILGHHRSFSALRRTLKRRYADKLVKSIMIEYIDRKKTAYVL